MLVFLGFAVLGVGAANGAVPTGSAANQASNWETHLLADKGIEAQCYKHEADRNGNSGTMHGFSIGHQVKLVNFVQSWPGDHWALLVIKAGTQNNVIYNPQAGVFYNAPQNKDVSHWIVCKGETPPPPPTTVPPTTVPPTTLPPEEPPPSTQPPTTQPPTTTPPVTTPPVPPTTPQPPTPPVAETPTPPTSSVSTPTVSTPAASEPVAPPTSLPVTGSHTAWLLGIAMALLVLGSLMLTTRKAIS